MWPKQQMVTTRLQSVGTVNSTPGSYWKGVTSQVYVLEEV